MGGTSAIPTRIIAVNLVCSQVPIGVEDLGTISTIVLEGVLHVLGLHMVQYVCLQL